MAQLCSTQLKESRKQTAEKMKQIPEHIIAEAVDPDHRHQRHLSDEREADFDFAKNGLGDVAATLHQLASFRAEAVWNEFKRAAGVNPKWTW